MSIICFYPLAQDLELGLSSGTYSLQGTVKRAIGRQSLQTNPTGTNIGYATVVGRNAGGIAGGGAQSTFGLSTAYFTFHVRIATRPASGSEYLFSILNGTSTHKLQGRLNTDGTISLHNSSGTLIATGATVLANDTWYRIGVQGSNGTNSAYSLFIAAEGAAFGAAELSGTANQGANNVDRIALGKFANLNSSTVDYYFQDIVIDDAAVWGPFNVGIALANGDTAVANWTGSYLDVDEFPHDGESTQITMSSTLSSDFEVENFSAIGGSAADTIHAVMPAHIRQRLTAFACTQRLRFTTGSTHTGGGRTSPISPNMELITTCHLVDNHDGQPWTPAKVDSAQVGINVQTISSNTARCTQVYLAVMFTKAASGSRRRKLLLGP